MNKSDVVAKILKGRAGDTRGIGRGSAPVNIALCKYWGKRDAQINLPLTSSLSVSLDGLGAATSVEPIEGESDEFVLNGRKVSLADSAGRRVVEYLDLFRPAAGARYRVVSETNVPVAAGVASSACGFAALALALEDLFAWGLDRRELSILARLGSGSASRSVYGGFVEWHAGKRTDGMDSYAERIESQWPDFRIGLIEISRAPKPIGSRTAMARTVATSELYKGWPARVKRDLEDIRSGIAARDIERVGQTAESNALAMHATMLDSRPAILYWKPETLAAIERIWSIRATGARVYFTMDAGPNIKLIFTERDKELVAREFAECFLDPQRGAFHSVCHQDGCCGTRLLN